MRVALTSEQDLVGMFKQGILVDDLHQMRPALDPCGGNIAIHIVAIDCELWPERGIEVVFSPHTKPLPCLLWVGLRRGA